MMTREERIKILQRFAGAKPDGVIGRETVGVAPREPLNTPVLVTNAMGQRSSEIMLMSYRV